MSTDLLQKALPAIEQWIANTLAQHASHARSVASLNFPRLGQFYPASLLECAKFVAVDTVPMPPLTALGLHGFGDFENMEAAGITYLDTYFIRSECLQSEALHFHELVHVVQCEHLGTANFLTGYALGHMLKGGYHGNPFEKVAYALQDYFESGSPPMDVVGRVQDAATRDYQSLLREVGST
jgi:hypothetical protein